MTKVLIVEDDVLNRMFYQAVFADRGFETVMVEDGAQVHEEVRRFLPDLITMDIQLPNVSGRQLIKELRQNPATRDIPVLAITAFAGPSEERRLRRAGASGYLSKPVTISRLLGEVDALLTSASATRPATH